MIPHWAGRLAALLTLLLIWFAPTSEPAAAQHAAAIAGAMIVLWATEAVPHAVAGFSGICLFWLLGVTSFATAFSGFANATTWLVLSALVIGAMAARSGLAERVAYTVALRVGTSYKRLVLGFILVDFLLTFLIPSSLATVTIMSAVVVGTVRALGLSPRSNVGRGLMIAVVYTATIFDKMVLGGFASILARGIIQDVSGLRVLYSQWFLAYVPCSLLTVLVSWRIVLWLFPAEDDILVRGRDYLEAQLVRLGPLSAVERRTAVLLAAAVALWMTDFVHHLSPTTVGMSVAVIAILPGVGVLRPGHLLSIRFSTVVFSAAALSMSRVLLETQGAQLLTRAMVGWLAPIVTGPLRAATVLYWTAFVYHFFMGNETGMLSTTLPAVLGLAKANGLSLLPVGMIWTLAAGGKVFAYQSSVLVVGYAQGYFDARDLAKVGLALTVAESLILIPLVTYYWPLIGI